MNIELRVFGSGQRDKQFEKFISYTNVCHNRILRYISKKGDVYKGLLYKNVNGNLVLSRHAKGEIRYYNIYSLRDLFETLCLFADKNFGVEEEVMEEMKRVTIDRQNLAELLKCIDSHSEESMEREPIFLKMNEYRDREL
jgi:hypothetical protein